MTSTFPIPGELGTPLPDSPHAVSVSMPAWEDVIGYEEQHPRVINALKTGYPRFIYHPITAKLFAQCRERFAKPGEAAIALPSKKVAEACVQYIEAKKLRAESPHPTPLPPGEGSERQERSRVREHFNDSISSANIHPFGYEGIYAVTFPETASTLAKQFWQHSGLIVSSRLAEAALQSKPAHSAENAKRQIRQQVAELAEEDIKDVWLYPSGMGALYATHRALLQISPGAKTIQLGFPYVDTLKIQEKFGAGCHYLDYRDANDLKRVETLLKKERIAAVFCEVPGNPLLQSIDLEALSQLLRATGVPLVIDNTLDSWANVELKPYADITATSLTKFFSGISDVLAGSLVIRPTSPYYAKLKSSIERDYEDLVCGEDAEVLLSNSSNFKQRINKINQLTEILCEYLTRHPAVDKLYYPKYITSGTYKKYQKPGAKFGGIFSLLLKTPEAAQAFYNALRVCKGPSLGTNYTLVCPYTLLAHYRELDFAAHSGVASHLIRVSVGLEESEELISRFREALDIASHAAKNARLAN